MHNVKVTVTYCFNFIVFRFNQANFDKKLFKSWPVLKDSISFKYEQ